MNPKQKVDICASILFLFVGIFLLLCPLVQVINIKTLFILTMVCYIIINFGKFLLTKENHDYEGLLSSIASLMVCSLAFLKKELDNPSTLAFLLFTWVILQSLIKLKKADYYHDRKSKYWVLEISLLIIFIITGILTSLNLNYSVEVKILVMGYFFFIHGILEFIDPVMIYLTKEKIKK